MNISATKGIIGLNKSRAVVIGFYEGNWNEKYDKLDEPLGGALRSLLSSKAFTGDLASLKGVTTMGKLPVDYVLLLGLGKQTDLDREKLKRAFAKALRHLKGESYDEVSTDLHTLALGESSLEEMGQILAESALLGMYTFDKYKASESPKKEIKKLWLVDDDSKALPLLNRGIDVASKVCESVNWVRDLVNTPPSDKNSEVLAETARSMAKQHKLTVKVFDKSALKKMGCNGLLAVNRGSAHDARMVIMEYKKSSGKPTVLVGKGITFDSGGLGIKPWDAMIDMKCDMSGAAAVLGTIKACAMLKLPVHVVGVVGFTDNMLGPDAYKPGDIIRAYNKKTIEIQHTDAEGRVILSDLLSYAAANLNPARIIDLATLTGACVVALGNTASGLMSNNDELTEQLLSAGKRSTDRVWQLPLYDDYKDQVKSDVADVKNVGAKNKAGAVSAGAFLSHFVGEQPWAHIDIAGPAYLDEDKMYLGKGATGAGVRLLVDYLRHHNK